MKRIFTPLLLALTAAMLATHMGMASMSGGKVLAYASSMSVSQLLYDTNAQRAAYGESYLHLNSQLDNAAQMKANDMAAKNYWGHYSPSGASPWSFILAAGYSYTAAGENLAYGYDNAAAVISAWMNSAEHRANILNGGFVDVGFGVVNSPNYVGQGPQTIVVAEYATPMYKPAPAPAPAPTPPAPTTTATPTTPTPTAPAATTPPAAATQPTPAAPGAAPSQPAVKAEAKPAARHKTASQPKKPATKRDNRPGWLVNLMDKHSSLFGADGSSGNWNNPLFTTMSITGAGAIGLLRRSHALSRLMAGWLPH